MSVPALSAREFLDRLRSLFRNLGDVFQPQERVEGGLDDIVRVRRANRFRQHIGDSRNLHHRAHRTSGNDPGSFGRWLQHHLPRAVQTEDLMRNRRALQIQVNQILLSLLDRLADGHGHFARLAHPETGVAVLSPTTTSAEKLRFLPPLTTLVTRWIATTWSFKLLGLTSMFRRTASVSLRMCLDINLKFQPRFPGCCG